MFSCLMVGQSEKHVDFRFPGVNLGCVLTASNPLCRECEVVRRHRAFQIVDIIRTVVHDRAGGRIPNYFVSDYSSVHPCAVRKFMNKPVDDYWFPCSVHILQLAMREAVSQCISNNCGRETGADEESSMI